MINLKTQKDIETLKQAGSILHTILEELSKIAVVGASSFELEKAARSLTASYGAVPAFLGYTPEGAKRSYPSALCLSVNNTVVHGIPNEKEFFIKNGDLVTIDMGISYNKLIVDSAVTIGVGDVDEKGKKLLQAGKECLDAATEVCKNWTKDFPKGIKTGDIGFAIEKALSYYKSTYGFSMAYGLGGHGVGFAVHEDPFIPNFGKKGQGPVLTEGMVIAIEPIVNEGKEKVYLEDDGYTIKTTDGKRSVHFEHTVAFTKDGILILT